jgi:hypothetical protein
MCAQKSWPGGLAPPRPTTGWFEDPPNTSSAGSTQTLHYGRACTPVAVVMPDAHWPGMWRIAWPAGHLSDIVNLARAKDAAAAIAERGPPMRNRHRFQWDRWNSRAVGPSIAQNEPTLPNPLPDPENASCEALVTEAAP